MGVDIYLKSGKNFFSCRLYWVTNLINDYSWQYKGNIPELTIEKKLNKKEIKELLSFLKFSLTKLKEDKKKAVKKFDSQYFNKAEKIHQSLKELINLINKEKLIKGEILPKLRGLVRRLENFAEIFNQDSKDQKEEIAEEFGEKISLVKRIIPVLKRILIKGGLININ